MPRSADRGITLYRSKCISPMVQLSQFRLIAHLMGMLFVSLTASAVEAQGPRAHFQHAGKLPPGAIGSQQLMRGGPLPGYFQPVEIKAPAGAMVSLAIDGQFSAPQATPLRVGMLIAPVYRFRVAQIPDRPGAEVYPTIEIINRIYPPIGEEFRFPIPIELTVEELEMALNGKFVTRVIYLEDPLNAVPVATRRRKAANILRGAADRRSVGNCRSTRPAGGDSEARRTIARNDRTRREIHVRLSDAVGAERARFVDRKRHGSHSAAGIRTASRGRADESRPHRAASRSTVGIASGLVPRLRDRQGASQLSHGEGLRQGLVRRTRTRCTGW